MSDSIDIILPIYRDVEATRRAIEAVLNSHNKCSWHLVLMNDASPEPEMVAMLESYCATDAPVSLYHNEENLGFVKTVNRAIALHDERDVVLLNSDTVVHGDWLDRLVAHAKNANDKVASITPFSNNATICSTPRIGEDNPDLTEPITQTAALDAIHANVNARQSVDIPTGVGFCMWLSRKALIAAGNFDEKTFGKGYGEEVDWCQRTALQGYRHVLACDVFVYHEGGVSFSEESEARKNAAQRILRQRHPRYEASVSAWVKRDPARPFRLAAVAEAMRQKGLPTIVHVNHSLGGGTLKHVRELCAFVSQANHLLLSSDPGGGVRLQSANLCDGVDVLFSFEEGFIALQDALSAFGVSRFHIHSILGFRDDILKRCIQSYGVPFDLTIHDYYFVCPQVFLIDADGRYCGEPETTGCNQCIAKRPNYDTHDINTWRSGHAWWFENAARILTPSMDVAARLLRYHPQAPISVMPHPEPHTRMTQNAPPPLAEQEPLRIAIIGVLAQHKGGPQLRALMQALSDAAHAVEFIHFGNIIDKTPAARKGAVSFTSYGRYNEDALPELLARTKPHLIWFPANWPETYSYTLSQAMQHGAPLWVPRLGAFSERTEKFEWSFNFDARNTAQELAEQLTTIRNHIASGTPPERETPAASMPPVPLLDCARDYLAHCAPTNASAQRTPGDKRIRVGWITPHGQAPDACGYIRIQQPLTHPAMAKHIKLVPLALHEAFHADVDAYIVARTTINAPSVIKRFIEQARALNIPVTYDLDDDIIHLPKQHPEYALYDRLKPSIKLWLSHANHVTVSTHHLANEVAAHRGTHKRDALIIPNYCDEQIWQIVSETDVNTLHASQPLKVLYMGTPTHQPDFARIAHAIKPILRRHNATLTLIGVHRPHDAPHWVQALEPPQEALSYYPDFVAWLQAQQREHRWQIGLAPLRDMPFNHAKSGIKFMEYSCLGLAGIYADLPPYRDVVDHNKNGLLAADSPAAWAEALNRLLGDSTLRTALAKKARSDTESRHILANDAGLWTPVWLGALGQQQAWTASAVTINASAQSFSLLIQSAPTRHFLKRAAKRFIHRYAASAITRRIWNHLPSPTQQWLKSFIRKKLSK